MTHHADGTVLSAAFRRLYLRLNAWIILGLFVLSLVAFLIAERVGEGPLVFLLQRFFHDVELSLPTLYNYFLLVANFALLAAIVLSLHARSGNDVWHWTGLAAAMLLMSYDEAAEVHEDIARKMSTVLPDSPFLKYAWTPLGALVVIVFALLYWPFLRRLPRRVAQMMALAGVIYVTGALGVETAGGWLDYYFGQHFWYHVVSAIEESMEMGGMVVFGYALLLFHAEVIGPAAAATD